MKAKGEITLSITVNIYYSGEGDSARKFAEEMVTSGIVDEIRSDCGNERYEYFFPMNDSETVLLIDSWKNQEALDRHHAKPLMKKIMALREKYDLHMRVERYISDTQGISQADKAFIKE